MDADGFLSPRGCTRCHRPLQGQDSGRPAELYAGTFTGLCYACAGAPAFVARRYDDGAVLWNCPPHAPSWRWDRETYTAYPDCGICRGRGYTLGSGKRFPAPVYCWPCLNRYLTHPVRQYLENRFQPLHRWSQNMDKEFARREVQAEKHTGEARDRRLAGLAMWAVEQCRRYDHARARHITWKGWYSAHHSGIIQGHEELP